MSTATKSHRETPTQALRRQLAEAQARLDQRPDVAELERLTAENARLDGTVQALAEKLSTVSEHRFPIDPVSHILAKRHQDTAQWAVLDDTLLASRFWGLDHAWHTTSGASAEAMFPWPEEDARRIGRLLAGQALLASEELSPEDEALADAHLAEVGEQLTAMVERAVPEAEVEARLQDALATVAARRAKPATPPADAGEELAQLFGAKPEAEDDTITLPAPVDRPDFQPEPPDAPESESPLTALAASIPANTEQPTVALPRARVHGPADTHLLHVPPIPPKPTTAPTVPLLRLPLPPITWGVGPIATAHGTSVPVQFAKT